MLKTVYQSTISYMDFTNQLGNRNRKRLFLGFGSILVDCPIRFFVL